MNWDAVPIGSNYFKREWCQELAELPNIKLSSVRAWDKAATKPSDKEPHPDYTACTQMWKGDDGCFYITGNHHPENYDEESGTSGRFREQPGTRDELILKQAFMDGRDCEIILPQDPGAAGKVEFQISSKKLMMEGFIVRKDPMPTQKSKLKKFEPFSAACENGMVYIIKSTFDKPTLDAFYKELEAFDGTRSSRQRHDDWADCTASAFNYLVTRRNHRIVVRNQIVAPTLKQIMNV